MDHHCLLILIFLVGVIPQPLLLHVLLNAGTLSPPNVQHMDAVSTFSTSVTKENSVTLCGLAVVWSQLLKLVHPLICLQQTPPAMKRFITKGCTLMFVAGKISLTL